MEEYVLLESKIALILINVCFVLCIVFSIIALTQKEITNGGYWNSLNIVLKCGIVIIFLHAYDKYIRNVHRVKEIQKKISEKKNSYKSND